MDRRNASHVAGDRFLGQHRLILRHALPAASLSRSLVRTKRVARGGKKRSYERGCDLAAAPICVVRQAKDEYRYALGALGMR